jgi:N-acetylmuramoyl-L-alanine amidase
MKIIEKIIDFFKHLFGFNKNDEVVKTETTENKPVVKEEDKVETSNDEKDEEVAEVEVQWPEMEISERTMPTHQPVQQKTKYHILIDNGHGNNTSGKRSPYSACGELPVLDYYEYKWAREMAGMIVSELKSLGYDAQRIVTEEYDVSLSERVRRVNSACDKYGASNVILISIHSNAAGSGSKWMTARGWSAYTTRGNTKSDILCECLYDEAGINFRGLTIRKDMSDGDSDLEADFTIIKNSKCPAVLSENFFHDNIEDVRYLLSSEGKYRIMRTHVDGIIKYIGLN